MLGEKESLHFILPVLKILVKHVLRYLQTFTLLLLAHEYAKCNKQVIGDNGKFAHSLA